MLCLSGLVELYSRWVPLFPVRKHYFLVILTCLKEPEATRKGAKLTKWY